MNGELSAITICRYKIIPTAIMISAPINVLIVVNVSAPHSQNHIFDIKLPRLSLNPHAENPIDAAVITLITMGIAKYFQSLKVFISLKVPT